MPMSVYHFSDAFEMLFSISGFDSGFLEFWEHTKAGASSYPKPCALERAFPIMTWSPTAAPAPRSVNASPAVAGAVTPP